MKRSTSMALVGAAALLVACSDARWPGVATEATRLDLVRAGMGTSANEDCLTQQVSDWGYEVRCGATTSYARCGYADGLSCCWPVEGPDEATDLLGQSMATRSGVVCNGTF